MIISESVAQPAIVRAMGRGVPSWKTPTTAPVAAPTVNWSGPSSADATPAWWGNGAITAAVALGRMSPTVVRHRKTAARKAGGPPTPDHSSAGRRRADPVLTAEAARRMARVSWRRVSHRLTWAAPIRPTALPANTRLKALGESP